MSIDIAWTRRRSAAIFGNEKFVEVVLALDAVPEPRAATAQELSRATGISHAMVRDVLRRMTNGDLLTEMPRVGGARSALYYRPQDDDSWHDTVTLARHLLVTTAQTAPEGQ